MPQYDYMCPNCLQERVATRTYEDRHKVQCRKCFHPVVLVPSVPASIPVGKYGKGGGR